MSLSDVRMSLNCRLPPAAFRITVLDVTAIRVTVAPCKRRISITLPLRLSPPTIPVTSTEPPGAMVAAAVDCAVVVCPGVPRTGGVAVGTAADDDARTVDVAAAVEVLFFEPPPQADATRITIAAGRRM